MCMTDALGWVTYSSHVHDYRVYVLLLLNRFQKAMFGFREITCMLQLIHVILDLYLTISSKEKLFFV